MHLGDSIFIFVLALVLFGPKRLPEIARQIGKLMAEFRRASNDFKMQMDDELRAMENQERQKQIAQAAASTATEAGTPAITEPAMAPVPGTSQLNIMPPRTGEQVAAATPNRIPPPEEAAAIAAATPLEEPVNRSSAPSEIPHETEQAITHG